MVEIPTLDKRTTIADPVHGHIPITNLEYNLLQIPSVMRLHRIKVMGLAYLVFPNAQTTRFTHCVGTMHIAGKMIVSVIEKMNKNNYKELFGTATPDYLIRTVRLAGLFHDIGHGPFSHTSEEIMKESMTEKEKEEAKQLFGIKGEENFPSHEYFTYKIISEDTDILNLLKGSKIAIEDILSILFPKMSSSKQWSRVVHPLISGNLDADRFDYLLRDSYMTGSVFGQVDINRIIEGLKIILVGSGASKRYEIGVQLKTLGSVEDVWDSRYKMYKWIYGHNLVVIIDYLAERALYQLLNTKSVGKEFFHWKSFLKGVCTDDEVLAILFGKIGSQKWRMFKGLKDRRFLPVTLFKRANDWTAFAREIAQHTGHNTYDDDSVKNIISSMIGKWANTPKENNKSIGRAKKGSTSPDLIFEILEGNKIRSPYAPLSQDEEIWFYENDTEPLPISTVSLYFRKITEAWKEFQPIYIGYVQSSADQARTKWKEYKNEIKNKLIDQIVQNA